jgi:nifR3 family TIM-barrel protein
VQIGHLVVDPPVVLAPMAGVTNAPFRRLARRFGAGLFVCEMVGARSLVDGDAKTNHLATFPADESPRSIQLYGTDPAMVGAAVALLVERERADHIDLNFGCPVPKVTRNGGGGALPWRKPLFRAIVAAAVANSGGVPITVKLRKGIDDDHLTYVECGLIAEEEGVAAVALHARTVHQLYSGTADWDAIRHLKAVVTSIPVLGNGDIWEASDAVRMVEHTGCDGVVVGRGCLGRPWLFGDLAASFRGAPTNTAPELGFVADVMREHATLLVEWIDPFVGIRLFRKHVGWYFKGYPVGPDIRRALADVSDLEELDRWLEKLDRSALPHAGATAMTRGHSHGPREVHLPHGYYEGTWDGRGAIEADIAVSGG